MPSPKPKPRRERPKTVYVAATSGERFHEPGCVHVDGFKATIGVAAVSRAEIQRRGLTPCRECKPTPLLTVIEGGRP